MSRATDISITMRDRLLAIPVPNPSYADRFSTKFESPGKRPSFLLLRPPCRKCSDKRPSSGAEKQPVCHELRAISKNEVKLKKEYNCVRLRPGTSVSKQYRSRQDIAQANESLASFFDNYKQIFSSTCEPAVRKICRLRREQHRRSVQNVQRDSDLFVTKFEYKENMQVTHKKAFKFAQVNTEHLIGIRERLLQPYRSSSSVSSNSLVRITLFSTDRMCRKLLRLREDCEQLLERTVSAMANQMKKETADGAFWCFAETEEAVVCNELHFTSEVYDGEQKLCRSVLQLILFCVLLEEGKTTESCHLVIEQLLDCKQPPSIKQRMRRLLDALGMLTFQLRMLTGYRDITVAEMIATSGLA